MTEQVPPEAVDDTEPDFADEAQQQDVPDSREESVRTGVPAVDDVLADVERLDETPLDEHLAAFERAHDSLRSALDADPGEPA